MRPISLCYVRATWSVPSNLANMAALKAGVFSVAAHVNSNSLKVEVTSSRISVKMNAE